MQQKASHTLKTTIDFQSTCNYDHHNHKIYHKVLLSPHCNQRYHMNGVPKMVHHTMLYQQFLTLRNEVLNTPTSLLHLIATIFDYLITSSYCVYTGQYWRLLLLCFIHIHVLTNSIILRNPLTCNGAFQWISMLFVTTNYNLKILSNTLAYNHSPALKPRDW